MKGVVNENHEIQPVLPVQLHGREPVRRDHRGGVGTGFGLSIVRALARAHSGDAVAENLAPSGGRVTVTLPGVPPSA